MKKFHLQKPNQGSFFDRQQRIDWWDQELLSNARILVVGAGAIGNEVLKNLVLTGAGNVMVADFDEVAASNLSRTVLFRKEDVGRKKAEVAAERTKELALAEDFSIHWFHGDIVWELGTGLYRKMDLVLGCLDNIEARVAVNRQCWLAGTPWIDAGIFELALRVNTYVPPRGPCFECSLDDKDHEERNKRRSCDDFNKQAVREGKVPTTQVAASMVAALQTQEAIKLLHGNNKDIGRKIYFQGRTNEMDIFGLSVNPECLTHLLSPVCPTAISISVSDTLRTFLQLVSEEQYSGKGASLDLNGEDWVFVESIQCRISDQTIILNRPNFRIDEYETVLPEYREQLQTIPNLDTPGKKKLIEAFSLEETSDQLLDMSLYDLGVPMWHVVTIKTKANTYHQYELAGDEQKLVTSHTNAEINS